MPGSLWKVERGMNKQTFLCEPGSVIFCVGQKILSVLCSAK